jgi:Pyridoxamine 5'-phosphate oxidase
MPGYGILPADQGRGLLPWSWAVGRLRDSHDSWLATTWPGGGAHVMPVWSVWHDDALWFSSSVGSRKAVNLAHDGRCGRPSSAFGLTGDDFTGSPTRWEFD